MIPINSIEIPEWIISLCDDWYDSNSMMHKVVAQGGLRLKDTGRGPMRSRLELYCFLWSELATELLAASVFASKEGDPDWGPLVDAYNWAEEHYQRLRNSYNLEN